MPFYMNYMLHIHEDTHILTYVSSRILCQNVWIFLYVAYVLFRMGVRSNSKTDDSKIFKLGIGNDLGIFYK